MEKSRGKRMFYLVEGRGIKIGELFPNHALESDDKEESEYASPMIVNYLPIHYYYYYY